MLHWRIDATSLASLVLVLAAGWTLPRPAPAALLTVELLFAAFGLQRARAWQVHQALAQLLRKQFGRQPGAVLGRQAPCHSNSKQVAHHCKEEADRLLRKLLDPTEGHLPLLQGGALISKWFQGIASPQQLATSDLANLLTYLLLTIPTTASSPGAAIQPASAPSGTQAQACGGPSLAAHGAAGVDTAHGPPNTVASGSSSRACLAANHDDSAAAAAACTPTTRAASTPADPTPDLPDATERVQLWAALLAEVMQLPAAEAAATTAEAAAAAAAAGAGAASDPAAAPVPVATSSSTATAAPRVLAPLRDPLITSYRPLLFYLLMETVAGMTHVALSSLGYKACPTPCATAAVYELQPLLPRTRRWRATNGSAAGTLPTAAPEAASAAAVAAAGGTGGSMTVPKPLAALGALVQRLRSHRQLQQADSSVDPLDPDGLLLFGSRMGAATVYGTGPITCGPPWPAAADGPADCLGCCVEGTGNTAAQQEESMLTALPATCSPGQNSICGIVKPDMNNSPVSSSNSNEEVVLFLHGIGLGLAPYLRFLARLASAADAAGSGGRPRRVLAVQYKHVSMRLTNCIPSAEEVAADVLSHLAAQGVARVSVVAHSYGTLVASAMNKQSPGTITRMTLVDPVCFAMFLPNLVRNMLYQEPAPPAAAASAGPAAAALGGAAGAAAAPLPRRWQLRRQAAAKAAAEAAAAAERAAEDAAAETIAAAATTGRMPLLRRLLKGLVVQEFHCAVALRRRLHWGRVNMWPSELPAQALLVLSGRDNLVPVKEVQAILANRAEMLPGRPHPTVLLNEDIGHGGFLANLPTQLSMIGHALDMPTEAVAAACAAARRRRAPEGGEVAAAAGAGPAAAAARRVSLFWGRQAAVAAAAAASVHPAEGADGNYVAVGGDATAVVQELAGPEPEGMAGQQEMPEEEEGGLAGATDCGLWLEELLQQQQQRDAGVMSPQGADAANGNDAHNNEPAVSEGPWWDHQRQAVAYAWPEGAADAASEAASTSDDDGDTSVGGAGTGAGAGIRTWRQYLAGGFRRARARSGVQPAAPRSADRAAAAAPAAAAGAAVATLPWASWRRLAALNAAAGAAVAEVAAGGGSDGDAGRAAPPKWVRAPWRQAVARAGSGDGGGGGTPLTSSYGWVPGAEPVVRVACSLWWHVRVRRVVSVRRAAAGEGEGVAAIGSWTPQLPSTASRIFSSCPPSLLVDALAPMVAASGAATPLRRTSSAPVTPVGAWDEVLDACWRSCSGTTSALPAVLPAAPQGHRRQRQWRAAEPASAAGQSAAGAPAMAIAGSSRVSAWLSTCRGGFVAGLQMAWHGRTAQPAWCGPGCARPQQVAVLPSPRRGVGRAHALAAAAAATSPPAKARAPSAGGAVRGWR